MSDETVVGGKRARGARRRKLTEQNTEDVPAAEIQIGDTLVHPKFRDPIVVNGKSSTETAVILSSPEVEWQMTGDVLVKRVLSEEDTS